MICLTIDSDANFVLWTSDQTDTSKMTITKRKYTFLVKRELKAYGDIIITTLHESGPATGRIRYSDTDDYIAISTKAVYDANISNNPTITSLSDKLRCRFSNTLSMVIGGGISRRKTIVNSIYYYDYALHATNPTSITKQREKRKDIMMVEDIPSVGQDYKNRIISDFSSTLFPNVSYETEVDNYLDTQVPGPISGSLTTEQIFDAVEAGRSRIAYWYNSGWPLNASPYYSANCIQDLALYSWNCSSKNILYPSNKTDRITNVTFRAITREGRRLIGEVWNNYLGDPKLYNNPVSDILDISNTVLPFGLNTYRIPLDNGFRDPPSNQIVDNKWSFWESADGDQDSPL